MQTLKSYYDAVQAYRSESSEAIKILTERCQALSASAVEVNEALLSALADEPADYNKKAEHKDVLDLSIQELNNWQLEIANLMHRVEAASKQIESNWDNTMKEFLQGVYIPTVNVSQIASDSNIDTPNDALPGMSSSSIDSPNIPDVEQTDTELKPTDNELENLEQSESMEQSERLEQLEEPATEPAAQEADSENPVKRSRNAAAKSKTAKSPE